MRVNRYELDYSSRHSYKDYIAQQYLKENIDIVISKNIREAVGSVEDILSANTRATGVALVEINESITDGFEVVSAQLDGIASNLDVINSNIVNGFQALFVALEEITSELAHLNRNVETLVAVARAPSHVWAEEKYEEARDVLRRGLFFEALEALQFAIRGNGSNTGYQADHRFHHLRGTILLGIPGEAESVEFVDLRAAEQAFLLAARYATRDNPDEAASALVGAGKAAYADKRLSDAEAHLKKALDLHARSGEANYHLARLRMQAGDTAGGGRYLANAFEIHWSYAVIRAASDEAFADSSKLVEECVRIAARKLNGDVTPIAVDLEKRLESLRLVQDSEYGPGPQYGEFLRLAKAAFRAHRSGRLKNAFEAKEFLLRAPQDLRELVQRYVSDLTSRRNSILDRGAALAQRAEGVSAHHATPAAGVAFLAVCCLGIFLFLIQFPTASDKGALFKMLGLFFLAAIGLNIAIVAGAFLTRLSAKQQTKAIQTHNSAIRRRNDEQLNATVQALQKIAQ